MGSHYYDKGEFKLPSVTTIISDCNDKSGALTNWAAAQACLWIKENTLTDFYGRDKEFYIVFPEDLEAAAKNYREVSQKALEIGSMTHAAIEEWLQTGREPIEPREEVLAAFVAFLEFFDEHSMKPIELEFSVYGDCWAGTLDYYGEFNGKLYVIDFKTSKYHYPNETGPQIAAYRSALKKPVDGCGILRLDKISGYPDWKDFSKRYERDLEHFLLMLPLFMHRHPRIRKNSGWDLKPF